MTDYYTLSCSCSQCTYLDVFVRVAVVEEVSGRTWTGADMLYKCPGIHGHVELKIHPLSLK